MNIRVVVVGGGSWGTTVASLAAKNTPTMLWARRSEVAKEIDAHHVNSAYLPGLRLTESLRATEPGAEAECVAAAGLSLGEYTALTFAWSLLWCVGFASVGWALGDRWDGVHHAFRYVDYAVVALVLAALGYLALRLRSRR